MSKRLKPGHFYIVKSDSETLSYCLYVDLKGNVLGFEYSRWDEGYQVDSDAHFQLHENLIQRAQEIPAPNIVWVSFSMNPFSDTVTGPVFSLTLFTGDVPKKFWDQIYSLADLRLVLYKHDKVTLQGIGTFYKTSKGISCFSSKSSQGLHVLCRDFFQPELLLAEFGLTPEGVERFLSEGCFNSWKDMADNPGYYECNGTVIPVPPGAKYYFRDDRLIPCFMLDKKSGCYLYEEFSLLSPCNLMNYRKDMYVGIRVSLNGLMDSPRGTFVLSQTFRSCQSILGDRVFWTLDDLTEGLSEILDQGYRLELPGLRMTFTADDGGIQMHETDRTVWNAVPNIRNQFLAQK